MTTESPETNPQEELQTIIASAKRLGIEMDEGEALSWLSAMAAADSAQEGGDIVLDASAGVYGHRVTMMDFTTEELARFRAIGEIVGFPDTPGKVETALALSGSAAQSRIQAYPGDCDFFERVNILAPSREEACRILAEVMRDKIRSTSLGDTYRMIEIKFGSYPRSLVRGGKPMSKGSPIAWTVPEAEAGKFEAAEPDGTPVEVTWDDVAGDPGWCKLDWVVADPIRKRLANASNMLDATWEAPDGSITPLDGTLDPYYQEVYLEAQSIPIFSKLAKQVAPDAMDDYVEQLEGEVRKYMKPDHLSLGKVARRMYNIFRLTGKYEEAVYLRELFDEPATVLYQVSARTRTLHETARPGSKVPIETLLAQCDALIGEVETIASGPIENEILGHLRALRENIASAGTEESRAGHVEQTEAELTRLVNDYFRDRLYGVPQIKEYLDQMSAEPA